MNEAIPAPYDWHPADKYHPQIGETVVIRGLYPPWGIYLGNKWMAVDKCGNRHHLAWEPEYWRREYRPPELAGAAQPEDDKPAQKLSGPQKERA